jgi:DNA-binding response OmpR family regulator
VGDKILVVDDSADTREMMAKLLELEAFNVVTAEDGRIGLEVADRELPDLIITDINMPNMSGIEMIRELRKQAWCQSVPIMAITAYGNGVAKDALEAGANRAATKPIKFNAVIVEIRELLVDRMREETGRVENEKQ